MPSASPWYPREVVRHVQFGDAAADAAADQKKKELTRDIGAAVAAFGLPIVYQKYAPKKFPRSKSIFVDVLAVVGVYFTARWAFKTISGG